MSTRAALLGALRHRVAKLRLFGGLLGDNGGMIALLALSSVLSGLAEAGVLAIVAQVSANLASGASNVSARIGPAVVDAAMMPLLAAGAALALLRLSLQIPISYVPARIASDAQASWRGRLFDAFGRASWTTQASDREGYLQELMGAEVIQVSGGTAQAATLVTSLATFAVLLGAALALNPMAAAIVVVVAICVLMLLRPLSAASARQGQAWADAQLDLASAVSEASRLAEETHVFGVAPAQSSRMAVFIEGVRAPYFRTQMIIRTVPNLYQSLIYLLLVGGLAGLHAFVHGNIASVGAVVLLLVRAAGYGNTAQHTYQTVKQSLPFVERVRSAEARYDASAPSRGSRSLRTIERLEFVDVCFSYGGGRTALESISFDARDGEAIGIAGPSGAGKSTVAQLLLQLRTPTSGHYLVNGEPAHEFREEDWHARVAYVPPTAHLIHASVNENIRYLRNFSEEAVEHAAKLAGIHDEIMGWEHAYQTLVGPRADAVSTGQAQRICLARALVGRPRVLVLDEPTSAVDVNSERLIQESLLALKGEVTLFVIAHRISTLDMCDRVMIILNGKLNAFEHFARLRQDNEYYRSVATASEKGGSAPLEGAIQLATVAAWPRAGG